MGIRLRPAAYSPAGPLPGPPAGRVASLSSRGSTPSSVNSISSTSAHRRGGVSRQRRGIGSRGPWGGHWGLRATVIRGAAGGSTCATRKCGIARGRRVAPRLRLTTCAGNKGVFVFGLRRRAYLLSLYTADTPFRGGPDGDTPLLHAAGQAARGRAGRAISGDDAASTRANRCAASQVGHV